MGPPYGTFFLQLGGPLAGKDSVTSGGGAGAVYADRKLTGSSLRGEGRAGRTRPWLGCPGPSGRGPGSGQRKEGKDVGDG